MSTTVILHSAELGEDVTHDLDHANRIFAYPFNHGWELNDPNFEIKDGIIVRTSSGEAHKADKQRTTKPGGTA